jgi:soluble lytic murein transglycosylase-like protein
MPPDIAEAVAAIESGYRPDAVGVVGEVGLMQIRPETAAMLGYKGEVAALFDPEVNVRYSVTYLAGAWRKADGDLCRTLMKYRAGHGTEYMTALSATYCGRARSYLAGIGSPLGEGASPVALAQGDTAPAAPVGGRSLVVQAREQAEMRKLKGAEFWAAHERRLAAVLASRRQ